MSVVFDFNTSLNDVAPVSPILLTVIVKRKGNSDSLMHIFAYFLSVLFTIQIEFSECCV